MFPVPSIDISNKFRIHWQSRDLTTTEECAVQIPFEGIPFIYIGEKAYMCHLGRSKASKIKVPLPPENDEVPPENNEVCYKRFCLFLTTKCWNVVVNFYSSFCLWLLLL